jgi:hypothetical protein
VGGRLYRLRMDGLERFDPGNFRPPLIRARVSACAPRPVPACVASLSDDRRGCTRPRRSGAGREGERKGEEVMEGEKRTRDLTAMDG